MRVAGWRSRVGIRRLGSRERCAFFAALGLVSTVWSESFFWGRFPPEELPAVVWLMRWVAYTVASYLAWRLLERFRVSDLSGYVLVGAVLGYLAEGAVVPEVYGGVPLSLVWTAVAWHGLLTVIVGWWLLPRFLARARLRTAVVVSGMGGAAVALWSVGLAQSSLRDEPEEAYGLASVGAFAVFAVVMLFTLAGAYLVLTRTASSVAAPAAITRIERAGWVLAVALVVGWTVVLPWALPCFAVVLLLVRRALRRRPPDYGVGPRLVLVQPNVALVSACAASAGAIATYAAVHSVEALRFVTSAVVLTLSAAAAVLFVWALVRAPRAPAGSGPGAPRGRPRLSGPDDVPGVR